MKRDKFKKMRLQLETLKPAKAEDCALLLQGLTMETSETSNFSMESVERKKRELKNGILAVEMEARGIRTDDKRLAHLKTGKQAEVLDYNYCLYNGVKTLAFQAKPLGQPHTSKFRKKKYRDTKLEVKKWKTIESQHIVRMISNIT